MDVAVDREPDGGASSPTGGRRRALGKRLGDLERRIGGTLPPRAGTGPLRRRRIAPFCSSQINEGVIPSGHVATTVVRFAATTGPIPVQHDTRAFRFTRENPEAIGRISTR